MTDWRPDIVGGRVQYETAGLEPGDLADDPMEQLRRWYADAEAAGLPEPNAMVLATVDSAGPDSRVVLARAIDADGVVFYTNHSSAKARQLAGAPSGAATFVWLDLHRQVRLRGTVARVADAMSDAYFASRPRESQIGAWASPQSEPIVDRAELDARVAEVTARFEGVDISRPPHWGGWRLAPTRVEFWQGRPNRLHDRLVYEAVSDGKGWRIVRLAP